ncbi:MAG: SAM hydrolase/SAM-dependent halogenase family protein [Anaerolineae bacterium]|jgi:S-adenosylmethionine hydrolase
MPIITLLTDFGLRDSYVAEMKGAILGICPEATLIDISHEVAPQQVAEAAFLLAQTVSAFPLGTVHLAVVDPGVGGARRTVAVATQRALLVAPDNGLLRPALHRLGAYRAVALENRAFWRCDPPSATFHGRDILAPVAAHLACGTPLEALGPGLPALEPLPDLELPARAGDVIHGRIVHIDRFGNLISNVPGAWLAPVLRWTVSLGERLTATLQRTYCDVRPGVAIALIGGHGYVEIAINAGDAAQALGLGMGVSIVVSPSRAATAND